MHEPQWVKELIGVPFQDKGRDRGGWDCWGCVREGLRLGFGVEVPSYAEDYTTSQERHEVWALIQQEARDWDPVTHDAARPGDVIVLRIAGQPWHCGLTIQPPIFLHCMKGTLTCLEKWESLIWRHRISGVYRHAALMVRGGDL